MEYAIFPPRIAGGPFMSMKAARGTKRVCHSCGSKFYDLNRDRAGCPICGAEYKAEEPLRKATLAPSRDDEAEDEAILGGAGAGVEFVPLDDIEETVEDDIPGLESDDLVPLEEEADLKVGADETFLEHEDDEESDLGGFIGGAMHADDEV
jgi:uncharacterized protein (TIGR02300 family)